MAEVGIKELLEAGVHFGHQTRRWNPRMRRFIYGEREGIHIIDLLQTEELLKQALLSGLDRVPDGQQVMFKLTLPETDGFYTELVEHAKVLRVVALSGGYSREEANARLSRNPGVVASFSRALTEGLTAQQSDEEFDAALDAAVSSIFAASNT